MHLPLSLIRTALYIIIIICSAFSFIFAAAFVGLTNSRYGYYYEPSVELLVTAILALAALPVLHFVLHRQNKTTIITSAVVELSVVTVLWLLYLGGAAAMADSLPGLRSTSYCSTGTCHVGRALQAFSWLAWITLTFQLALLVTVLVLNSRSDKSAWRQPFRQSTSSAPASKPVTTDKQEQQSFIAPQEAGSTSQIHHASVPYGTEQMQQMDIAAPVQQQYPYGNQV
ncbi:hypothetical protein OIV83_001013 [Microbotryomycetes sp. JL201]|nr:hypothetical protein OIV83_001013 [Microbotryomycetes sp. JL201]